MPNQVKRHAKRLPDVVDVVDVVVDPHVSVPDRPSAMTSLYILVLASQVALVEAMDFCLI
tara:strand:- start:1641 stop:1820 length:180 start_codon:yes stop_codon:yes gene_type:complete